MLVVSKMVARHKLIRAVTAVVVPTALLIACAQQPPPPAPAPAPPPPAAVPPARG